MSPRAAKKTDSGLAARLAAIASFGAAIIHFAVVPTHWQAWMPSGLFFLSMALIQLIWARMVLARPNTAVLAAGIAANVGAAALWVMSRTSGAPFGPHAGEPELVQAAGLCALLLEIYVVMGAGWVWYRGQQPAAISAFANAMVLVGASAVIAAAATAGVASSLLNDDHHAPADAEHGHPPPNSAHQDGHRDHSEPVAPPVTEVTPRPNAPVDVTTPPVADPSHGTDGDHHSE